MTIVVTIIHVLVCLFMMLVILLQPGRGGGMGTAFGASPGATQFLGAGGASTLLSKLTTTCAVLFMVTSLTLAYFSSRNNSVINLQGEETLEGLNAEEGAGAGAGSTDGTTGSAPAAEPILIPLTNNAPSTAPAAPGTAAAPASGGSSAPASAPAPGSAAGSAPAAPISAPAGSAPAGSAP